MVALEQLPGSVRAIGVHGAHQIGLALLAIGVMSVAEPAQQEPCGREQVANGGHMQSDAVPLATGPVRIARDAGGSPV